uniref:aspartate transaminase n=1 Tax=Nipponaphis monzeni TaxID=196483 RepID=A0A481MQI8_9HEMI
MSLRVKCVPEAFDIEEEIIKTMNDYDKDVSLKKIDLIIGVYRSEDGDLYLLPVVKKAQQMVLEETLNHNYLSIRGIDEFTKAACTLILGDIEKQWNDETIFGFQCIGGAGALKIGADFLHQFMECTTVYFSDPTWVNHEPTFKSSGFKNIRKYRYFKKESKSLDIEGIWEDLSNAPENSVVILQVCGHNPTCVDPTKEQWKKIAKIIKEQKLIPFFDIAYQGFASGDLIEDAWVIRYFFQEGIDFICAQSFSKIFTMYNERVGNLMFSMKPSSEIDVIKSNVSKIVRCMYSNPPNHGTKTILKILTNSELYNEWSNSFTIMVSRIKTIRIDFRKALEDLGAPGKWNYITDHGGMFILLNFTSNQLEYFQQFYHIYVSPPGRLNVTGLNTNNIDYIAKAVTETLKKSEKNIIM